LHAVHIGEGLSALEDGTLSPIVAIVFCLVASALFSATETALTSLSHSRVHQLIDRGRRSALLKLWQSKPNHVLTTILIGNNIVNILASSLATKISYHHFRRIGLGDPESMAVAAAVGIMTLIILIFGEVVPKTYAKHNVEKLMPLFAFTHAFYYLFLPLAALLVYISRTVVWLGGGKFRHEGPLVTEEDLEWMIRRGTQEKSLAHEVGHMLAGALDLDSTAARQVMVPRTKLVMFEANETLTEVLERHREHNYSRYPVYDDTPDRIVGILYIKDLLYYLVNPEGKDFQIRDLMRTDLYFIPESKNVREILTELKKRQIGMGIVVDEFGGVSGILSLEDILEEMVGEIYDEFDEPAHAIVEESPRKFRVQAQYMLADLESHLPFSPGFPLDKGYDTVGGLLMDLAGRVPQAGESFAWPSTPSGVSADNDEAIQRPLLVFTILSAGETRIDSVLMEVVDQDATAPVSSESP
jgi:CBS domain containing-hemolysin-like protein